MTVHTNPIIIAMKVNVNSMHEIPSTIP